MAETKVEPIGLAAEKPTTVEPTIVDQLIELGGRLNSEQKRDLANALGLTLATGQDDRQGQTNEDVQRIVRTVGEVIRDDPDWLPAIPESVQGKGPTAVKIYLEKWKKGQPVSPGHIADQVDAEKAAGIAVM